MVFLGFLMAWAGYEQAVVILGMMTVACTIVYLLIMAMENRKQKTIIVENPEGSEGN